MREVLAVRDLVVLDFGCGSGRFLPLTVGIARYVVGLDISEQMLRLASVAVPRGRCDVVLFDGENVPFVERAFDAILSVGTLQCLADEDHFQRVVGQLGACVRADGAIYLLEQVRARPTAWQRTAEEYQTAFGRLGWSCRTSYPVRNGRSLLLYAIRYGMIPRRWLPALAAREMERTRRRRPSPWVPYQDCLFVFAKS
jgi:SAM-dependent methyltransferase